MSYKKLNRLFIILVICNFVLMPLHILGAKYIRNSSSQSDMVVTDVEKNVHIDVSTSIESDCVTTLETETTIETEYIEIEKQCCSYPDAAHVFFNYDKYCDIEFMWVENKLYLPLTDIAERLFGASRDYSTESVTITSLDFYMQFDTTKNYIIVNDRCILLTSDAKFNEDEIYLTIQDMSKIFNFDYIATSAEVSIFSSFEMLEHGSTFYDEIDLYWLSRIISAEARGEPLIGKLAVGTVVMNRKEAPHYPDSIKGVIFDPGQFSPASGNAIYKTPTEESIVAAKIVLEGYRLNNNILYFCTLSHFDTSKLKNFKNTEYTIIIGNHVFQTYWKELR